MFFFKKKYYVKLYKKNYKKRFVSQAEDGTSPKGIQVQNSTNFEVP